MVGRLCAGAARLPFWTMRNYMGTDLPAANPRIKTITCPYTGEPLATVPALNPDVTIVHAQRADAGGNTQIWGLLGVQKEAAFASSRVIVVVEELVDESVIRADPNRTLIPGMWSTRCAGALGATRPMPRALIGITISTSPGRLFRGPVKLEGYIDEFVLGVPDRAGAIWRQPGLVERLKAKRRIVRSELWVLEKAMRRATLEIRLGQPAVMTYARNDDRRCRPSCAWRGRLCGDWLLAAAILPAPLMLPISC
jgi:glutaconate CoA-transferase subunit A